MPVYRAVTRENHDAGELSRGPLLVAADEAEARARYGEATGAEASVDVLFLQQRSARDVTRMRMDRAMSARVVRDEEATRRRNELARERTVSELVTIGAPEAGSVFVVHETQSEVRRAIRRLCRSAT